MKLRTVFFGIAAFTGAGLLLLIAAWAVWLNVEKGKVRAIQDEMRAEGLPMTAADLEPPPLAEADNAAPLLERAAELLKELKKREGWIDAVPLPGKERERSLAAFDPAKLQRFREQMAWPETQEVLRLLREAVSKPGAQFNRDLSSGPSIQIWPVAQFLDAGRLLGASAWLRASDGSASAAIEDLQAAARLGDFVGTPPVIIDWLVSITVQTIAVQSASAALGELPQEKFDPKAWAKLASLWKMQQEELRAGMSHALDSERVLFGGWLLERMAGSTTGVRDFWSSAFGSDVEMKRSTMMLMVLYSHPWSPLMQMDHAAYLRFMLDFRRSVAAGDAGEGLVAQVPKSAILTRLSVRAIGITGQRLKEIATQLQLGRVGIALEQWRAEHGRYPKTLAELGLPVEETTDVYRGKPLFYRVEGDGVVLYSGGKDRKDDGGTTEKRSDLVWRVQRGSVSSAE